MSVLNAGSNDKFNIEPFAWSVHEVNSALEVLLARSGITAITAQLDAPPRSMDVTSNAAIETWLTTMLYPHDVEIEGISTSYVELDDMIAQSAPCILEIPEYGDERHYLVVAKSNTSQLLLLNKTMKWQNVPTRAVIAAYRYVWEAPYTNYIDKVLRGANVAENRLAYARKAMLAEQLRTASIHVCTMLKYSPGGDMWTLIQQGKVLNPLFYIFLGFGLQQGLGVLGWVFIGGSALSGYFEDAYLFAWALLLLTGIPVRLMVLWFQSVLSLNFSILFKQRLLYGILQLQPEEIRSQGSGQFLSRVMEMQSFEQLVLSGGFQSIMSIVQIGTAAWILALGAGGGLHAILLFLWLALASLLFVRYVRRSLQWIKTYRGMTNDLVERMVGHRTRLIQEHPDSWHVEEDTLLNQYLNLSRRMDIEVLQLQTFLQRGWFLASLLVLSRAFVFDLSGTGSVAVSIGGILLAAGGFGSFVGGLSSLMNVFITWQEVRPLMEASGRRYEPASVPAIFNRTTVSTDARTEQPLIVMRDINFRYQQYGQPIFKDTSLDIHQGERILIEGPSGGGKSTLANLLTSLKQPNAGLILLNGLDLSTIGAAEWRQRVVYVPQFHENYVLNQTFAFNLLMGRGWPPEQADLDEAEEICRELGLGDLLDRMPSGLQQIVGENGWQLSHGERSRLYIARALLQQSDIIILDESFAALDPETRSRALQCVLRRAPTLMVIAHP